MVPLTMHRIYLFVTLVLLWFTISHTKSLWDKEQTHENGQFQLAALPCKFHNDSLLDCSKRGFNRFPPLPNTQITAISYQNNNFTTIPVSLFSTHPELLRLDFKVGNLADIHPDAFLGLQNLTSLILAANRITTLPAGIFHDLHKLQVLDLSLNYIKIFPSAALTILKSLVDLDLIGNRITTFPSNITKLQPFNLQKLHMSSQTTNLYTTTSQLVSKTANNDNVYIDLDDVVGDISPPIVLRKNHFQDLTNLEHFEWLFNPFVEMKSDTFTPLTNLKTLIIDCSGYNATEPLNRTLISLNLSCMFGGTLPDIPANGELGAFYLQRLASFSLLSSLALHSDLVSISDGAFHWIPSLRKLDLNGNNLRHLSAYAFEGLPFLEELDLSFNSFTLIPSDALQILVYSSNLRILNLDSNWLEITSNIIGNHSRPLDSSQHSYLEELVLSNNKIMNLSVQAFTAFSSLPSLRVLDLSGNVVSSIETWRPTPNLEELYLNDIKVEDTLQLQFPVALKVLSLKSVLHINLYGLCSDIPNLENLTFTGSSIDFSFFYHCNKLRMLDLSDNQIDSNFDFYKIYIDQDEGWMGLNMSKLEVLILSNNELSYLNERTFERSPLLIEMDFSANSLTNIHSRVFTSLRHLQKINLSRNKLVSLEPLLYLPSAKLIDVSFNKIVSIPAEFLPRSGDSSLDTLDLSGNPLQCTCIAKSFQDWIFSETKVLLQFDPGFYNCAAPEQFKGFVITAVLLDCKSHLEVYLGVGVAIFVVFSVFILIAFKYRWHINYKLFLLFKRSKHVSYIDQETLVESSSNPDAMSMTRSNLYFDAYIACSKHDEDWVYRELRPHLEDTENPVKLFIGSRDFPLGDCILDCIVEGIQKSRKTVLILSPRFVEDEWCYFELQMAHQRLFQDDRDVLVMVLFEEIQNEKLTLLLRHMLCQKQYLNWPSDKLGQELFWQRLKEEIRRPSKVDRINQM